MTDELDPFKVDEEDPLEETCQSSGFYTFRDPMAELHAYIPDDPVQKFWPLKGGRQRVLAWLAEKYFSKHGEAIYPATLSAFFQVLEGRAYQRSEATFPDESTIVAHVVNEPLVQAIVKFMDSQRSDWEGLTSDLLKLLERLADANK